MLSYVIIVASTALGFVILRSVYSTPTINHYIILYLFHSFITSTRGTKSVGQGKTLTSKFVPKIVKVGRTIILYILVRLGIPLIFLVFNGFKQHNIHQVLNTHFHNNFVRSPLTNFIFLRVYSDLISYAHVY